MNDPTILYLAVYFVRALLMVKEEEGVSFDDQKGYEGDDRT